MDRRAFLKKGGGIAVISAAAANGAFAFVPAHNWENYDFGPGPVVTNRLKRQDYKCLNMFSVLL